MKEEQNKHHRSPWTQSEDEALIYVKETLGLEKWTDIAQKLTQIYHIEHKNHQHCSDRYVNFLQHRNDVKKWPHENYDKLIQLYMQHGNKWSEIAHHFNNIKGVMIKNKFYSRLRKGIRNLNHLIQDVLHENWQKFNFSIIYKLVNCAANKYDFQPRNILSKRVQQKIYFIEENIRIIYRISWMNKLSLQKSFNNQKDNLFKKQNVIKLIEQINLIDQNFDKKHTNRKVPLGLQSQVLKKGQGKGDRCGDEIKNRKKENFGNIKGVEQQAVQQYAYCDQKLKKIKIISYSSLQKLLSQSNLSDKIFLHSNNMFPPFPPDMSASPRKNSKPIQASYRVIRQPISTGVKGRPIYNGQLSNNQ